MRSRQVDPAIHLTEEDSTRTLGIALELISLHDPLKILLVLPFPELIHSLTVQKPANSCALGVSLWHLYCLRVLAEIERFELVRAVFAQFYPAKKCADCP